VIDFTLDSSDTSSTAVALWISDAFPHLHDCFSVEAYAVHGGWFAKGHYDIRGEGQWNPGHRFASREEAAPWAADVFAECVRLVLARHRGEPLKHPGSVMAEEWEASAEAMRLAADLDAARGAVAACVEDDVAWRHARMRVEETWKAAEQGRDAWFRAQDWRGFRDGLNNPSVHPDNCRRGQMALLDLGTRAA
jgi:hypothetical protein